MIKKTVGLATLTVLVLNVHATITVLDYWRMGENDPGAMVGALCTNTVDVVGGNTLTNTPVGGPFTTYTNAVSPAAAATTESTLALVFTNNQYCMAALATNLADNFGIECWVKPGSVAVGGQVLAYNGLRSNGWGLYQNGSTFEVLYGGDIFFGSAVATVGIWMHLALVRNSGVAILYTNGVPASTNSTTPITPSSTFTVGGDAEYGEYFTGAIDDVRVFTFAPGAFSTNDLLLNHSVLVTSASDSGPGSLRQIMSGAMPGDVIVFTNTLSGATIPLTNGQLTVDRNLTIDASGLPNGININGRAASRIFQVNAGITAVLNSLTLTNGFATNAYGGGIYDSGTLTINQCTIANCTSSYGGGGIYSVAPLTINNSTISGCSSGATGQGGAIETDTGCSLALNQCTLAGNSAPYGGALFIGPGSTSVVNQSTVSGNRSTTSNISDGCIHNSVAASSLTVENSIVAGNTPADIIGAYIGVTNLIGGNPVLGPLAYNGGPTLTMLPLPGSPAIDAGNDSATNTFATDQRGFPRLSGLHVDLGSVEVTALASVATLAATGVAINSATLNAVANPAGTSLSCYFQYGLSTNYGSFTTTNTLPAVNQAFAVSNVLNNLLPATVYHFRAVAFNGIGTYLGSDLTFTTLRAADVVTNANDSGPGSLRAVIAGAASGDVIHFATNLSGQAILLTSGELFLTNNLNIDASALANGIHIIGHNSSRIFEVTSNATVVLNALTLTNGNASLGGGIQNNIGCTLILSNTTITGCFASYGGAINSSGLLTLNQCTLSGNTAGALYGGAVEASGTMAVNQSTIAGNTVSQSNGEGGGIYIISGSLTLFNSIVAGNNAATGADILNFGSTLTRTGTNIVQSLSDTSGGTDSGSAAINTAPLLAPLGNYGGPTPTRPPLPGSPAVDAGNDSAMNTFATDQRGFPRRSGLHVDIGAVEGVYNSAGPGLLTGVTELPNGSFQFSFTNFTDATFSVLASTNVAMPAAQWSNLGAAVEASPGSGQFQFTDPQATNNSQRFYRVRSQ